MGGSECRQTCLIDIRSSLVRVVLENCVYNLNAVRCREEIHETPFGYYAPSPLQNFLISLANRTWLGRGRMRWWISALIEQIKTGPVDVQCLGLKMRLHHYGLNTGEKKMLLNIKGYDWKEITYLKQNTTGSFHFVDIGANVGFYSFAVKSSCPGARIVAFEPDPVLVERLTYNVRANNLTNFSVIAMAVAGTSGTSPYFTDYGSLLGQGESINVPVVPLYDSLTASGLPRVDALKIDIEGFEDRVLFPFFKTAPRGMWPGIIIIEHCLRHLWNDDCLDLCRSLGYRFLFSNRRNAVLARPDQSG
jgi:FkbM family methyltransferase